MVGIIDIRGLLYRLAQSEGSGLFGLVHKNTCAAAWALCLEVVWLRHLTHTSVKTSFVQE